MDRLSREDPSINVREDEETGQLIINGLGELHLEIIRDRIEEEYGISSELGKMRVAYRESASTQVEGQLELQKTIGGAHMYAKLAMSLESQETEDATSMIRESF